MRINWSAQATPLKIFENNTRTNTKEDIIRFEKDNGIVAGDGDSGVDTSDRRYINIPVRLGFNATKDALLAYRQGNTYKKSIHGQAYEVIGTSKVPESLLREGSVSGSLINRSTDTSLGETITSVYEYQDSTHSKPDLFYVRYGRVDSPPAADLPSIWSVIFG